MRNVKRAENEYKRLLRRISGLPRNIRFGTYYKRDDYFAFYFPAKHGRPPRILFNTYRRIAWCDFRATLVHELAHAVAWNETGTIGHGDKFQRIFRYVAELAYGIKIPCSIRSVEAMDRVLEERLGGT